MSIPHKNMPNQIRLRQKKLSKAIGGHTSYQSYMPKHQRGAVLLVALIMLLVLTLLGVASIDSSGMQTRMANNQRDRIIAMQAAEAGLLEAENYLENMHFTADNIGACEPTSPDCFDASCEYGLCFTGLYVPILVGLSSCTNVDVDGEPRNNPLLDVFNDDNNRSRELIGSAIPAKVKYYIEFRCYTKADVLGLLALGNTDFLFRITSYAETDSGRGRVMLQSTYSIKGS